jgi:hypothetical protein
MNPETHTFNTKPTTPTIKPILILGCIISSFWFFLFSHNNGDMSFPLVYETYITISPMNELNSLYDLIGGETGVRTLVERFYDIMDSSPEAKDIRALHAASLTQSREKLFSSSQAGQVDHRSILKNTGIPAYVSVICRFPLAAPNATSGCGA